jgi:hypothetical protein
MPRGGARPNSGPKPGSKLVKAKAVIEKAAEAAGAIDLVPTEVTKLRPLDVLLRAMWTAVSQGNWSAAASFARECAPYCHPKLSAVDTNLTVKQDVSAMSDVQILQMLSKANAKLPQDSPSVTVN